MLTEGRVQSPAGGPTLRAFERPRREQRSRPKAKSRGPKSQGWVRFPPQSSREACPARAKVSPSSPAVSALTHPIAYLPWNEHLRKIWGGPQRLQTGHSERLQWQLQQNQHLQNSRPKYPAINTCQ